jgi:hypothetical protein
MFFTEEERSLRFTGGQSVIRGVLGIGLVVNKRPLLTPSTQAPPHGALGHR